MFSSTETDESSAPASDAPRPPAYPREMLYDGGHERAFLHHHRNPLRERSGRTLFGAELTVVPRSICTIWVISALIEYAQGRYLRR